MSRDEDDAIGSEAAYWLAAMRAPDADARRAEFEAWKASDPRHASAYAHVETLFALSAASVRGNESSGDGTIAAPSSRQDVARRPPAWRPVGIAAALVATIALGAITYTHSSPTPTPQVAHGVKDSAPQLRRLGDGSLVLLGAATLITADLSDAVRRIRIAGSARFIVARDPGRPFIVVTRGPIIQSSDGVFDVAIVGTDVEITARRGNITVGATTDGAPRALEPGSTVRVDASGTQSAPAAARDWPLERLEVDAMSLGDVIALANSFGGTPIVVAAPDVARLRLSGTFDIRDTTALARKIAAAFDLKITAGPDQIVLAHKR